MRFRYLRDPLFLVCLMAYFINRWVLKAIWESGFVHDHLNDLICIPFWVPIMVWMERRVGVRRHDGPPDVLEIAAPLVIWSWAFEVALPGTELFSAYCKADHQDVMFYALGALGATLFWRWWYGVPPGGDGSRLRPGEPRRASSAGAGSVRRLECGREDRLAAQEPRQEQTVTIRASRTRIEA